MDKFSLEAGSAHSVGCTYASITWQGADMDMSTGWVTNTAAGLTYVVQKLTSASSILHQPQACIGSLALRQSLLCYLLSLSGRLRHNLSFKAHSFHIKNMFAALALTILASSAALFAHADPDPNNPGPGDVFIEGQACSMSWNPDTTGVWKTMLIQLKTGDNFDMVNLTTVGTVDGTDATKTSFSYPCPKVTPHSPIYFYQFSSPASANSVWTGRFTITDSVTDIVPATESTQPDGSAIPWGTGSLVNSTSTTTVGTTSPASATAGAIGTPSATSSSSSVNATTASASPTPTPSSGSQATGGGLRLAAKSIGWKTALTLGVSALGFTLML